MTIWFIFLAIIVCFLALDLGVFNKDPHVIGAKEAGKWTLVWVSIAVLFSIGVYWIYAAGYVGNRSGLTPNGAVVKYLTGYLIELSLSIDNIFVIAIIFSAFGILPKYQHRILFWGIVGAVIFRGSLIYFGVLLINKFNWMSYIFGAFLIFTALKMLLTKDKPFEPKKSRLYRSLGKIIPITHNMHGRRFFISEDDRKLATPLFIALIVIEMMDVVFALDSVPAILSITSDPFIVFTSNIFAILGLRSMYFLLAHMLKRFDFLEYSLIAILIFVGIKMFAQNFYTYPEWLSLSFIAAAFLSGIAISIYRERQ